MIAWLDIIYIALIPVSMLVVGDLFVGWKEKLAAAPFSPIIFVLMICGLAIGLIFAIRPFPWFPRR